VPVGCLPNLGHPQAEGWGFDRRVGPAEFADDALEWIECGARIVGGCCGVGPEHIAATRRVLESAAAWSARGV
jgi:methionine synthase I (cobalamin-dependent)